MKKVLFENKDWMDGVWRKIEKKVSMTSDRIRDGMPYTTKNGLYDDYQSLNPSWWTNGQQCRCCYLLWLNRNGKGRSRFEKELYLKSAIAILKTLDEKCGIWDDSDEALLKDGTSQYHLDNGPYEVKNGALIYGDFYFVEAICKLKELNSDL